MGKADSLAYHGKVGKTYGPFKKENILVKILVKAPNTFYHIKHILIDTSVFEKSFAESLASNIMWKIETNKYIFGAGRHLQCRLRIFGKRWRLRLVYSRRYVTTA